MQIWNSINQAKEWITAHNRGSVITVGNFDGVHRGHQAIIRRVIQLASVTKALAVALTFTDHSDQFFARKPRLINSPAVRRRLFDAAGIDALVELSFDRHLATMKPEDFLQNHLKEELRAIGIVVGYDFRFGVNGSGNYQLLQQWGTDSRIRVEQVPPVSEGEVIISSSEIRKLLLEGRIETANQMLGYPFVIEGRVIKGERRGRKLGFPTANIPGAPEYILPCYGVYLVRFMSHAQIHFGIANVGVKPTFGKYDPLIEVFLFDVELDLYGKSARVEFLRFIRPEIRFAEAASLIAQMNHDVLVAREMLTEISNL